MQQCFSETSARSLTPYFVWGTQQKDWSFFSQGNRKERVRISKETAFCHSRSAGMWSSDGIQGLWQEPRAVCCQSLPLAGIISLFQKPASFCPTENGCRTWLQALPAHLAPAGWFTGNMPCWLLAPSTFPSGWFHSAAHRAKLRWRKLCRQGNHSIRSPSFS